MAADHTLALQTAILAAMGADLDLTALIGTRAYDYVPANPEYPFCRIGPMRAEPFEGDCIEGSEIRFTVHGFTKGYGRESAADLSATLVNLFARATLDLGNGITANLIATGWSVTEDPDEKAAWHASVNLLATTTS